jgi:xanthine dehydrogenase YagR molybdenum-binding subunit
MIVDAGRLIGKPAVRIDGPAKVTGQARYASDEPVQNPAFAWLVTSAVGRGRIRRLDLGAAQAVPGVLDILTHENVGHAVKPPLGPDGHPTTTTL